MTKTEKMRREAKRRLLHADALRLQHAKEFTRVSMMNHAAPQMLAALKAFVRGAKFEGPHGIRCRVVPPQVETLIANAIADAEGLPR